MEKVTYAAPQLKVYGSIQEVTQTAVPIGNKNQGEPSDGLYVEGLGYLTGSCHCT